MAQVYLGGVANQNLTINGDRVSLRVHLNLRYVSVQLHMLLAWTLSLVVAFFLVAKDGERTNISAVLDSFDSLRETILLDDALLD